jgi:serine/threonine-protein kinase HipA
MKVDTEHGYLKIARVLVNHGPQTDADLQDLWSRTEFNLLVSNTDAHLRNHGFILTPGKGWRLSDAYDKNPAPGSSGLKLNISEADNAMDLDLARSVAHYFRVDTETADAIIERSQAVGRQWQTIAGRMGSPLPRQLVPC